MEIDWLVKINHRMASKSEDIKLESRAEVDEFKQKHQVVTTPQIFFDRERIGGYEDLADCLKIS